MIQIDKLTKDMKLFIPKGCGCTHLGEDDYYTKDEVDERFARKQQIPDVSNFVTSGDVENQITAKNYATKTYVDDAIQEATSGITYDAYTKAESDARYATKSEVPDVSGFATKAYVDTGFSEIDDELNNFYTKTQADNRFLTDITITINNQQLHNGGSIEVGEGGSIVVDASIDSTSTNPVQNRVIKAALDNKADVSDIPTSTSDLVNDSHFVTAGSMFWLGTKAEYLALETYDPNVLYLTKE